MSINQDNAPQQLDALSFIKFLVKWRKQLVLVLMVSIIGSYLLTYLITPMYKSTAVVYPYNLGNYSKESATEQMIQLLKSENVREDLIKAFNLYVHYDIDTAGNFPRHEIMLQLDENISINKTEYESVEINVLDKDPVQASQMCDSLIVFMDRKALSLIREKAVENLVVVTKRLKEKTVEMDSMERELTKLSMQYGVLDYENQVQGFSREYYRSLGGGGSSSRMEQAKRNLEEKGNIAFSLKENLWRVRGQYNDIKKQYEDGYTELTKTVSFHNTVSAPSPAEKKDSPKRMALTLLFTLSVMTLAILVIIYIEYFKRRVDTAFND